MGVKRFRYMQCKYYYSLLSRVLSKMMSYPEFLEPRPTMSSAFEHFALEPRPNMSSASTPVGRPIRSTRLKQPTPILPEIMARINNLHEKYYENIRNEFNSVSKYFKDNHDDIAEFWLNHYPYNLTDFKHQYLARLLFETVGFKQSSVKEMLDRVGDKDLLKKMGVQRFVRGGNTFYRIQVGDYTEFYYV